MELLVWQWVSHLWAEKRVVHLLVGTSQLTFWHTHWDGDRERGDRHICMCDENILFSLCLFIPWELYYLPGLPYKIPQTGWFKPQTFIFAQLRKLKVHDLGACRSTSGENLSGLPEGPHFTGPSHGLPSKHQHLCYLFLSLKDINHVGLRFDS